jgi:predicted amidohydrolase YtcJ
VSAYTWGPAIAAGLAGRAGEIAPGRAADLAAWNLDPAEITADEALDLKCLATVVGGEIVHRM